MSSSLQNEQKPDYAQDRLQWAAAELRVAVDAPPGPLASEFLRRMQAEDYLPPSATVEAFDLLTSARAVQFDRRDPDACHDYFVEKSRAQIAELANSFFALHPDARHEQFAALARACANHAPCAARLRLLQRGLQVELPGFGDEAPLLGELAQQCAELFVLPPHRQAARRQQLLFDSREEVGKWRFAARALQQKAPQVAALAPEYIQTLLTRHEQIERQARLEQKAVKQATRQAKEATRGSSGSLNSTSGGWIIFLIVISCMNAVRVSMTDRSTSSRSRQSTPAAQTQFNGAPYKLDAQPNPLADATNSSFLDSANSSATFEGVRQMLEANRARVRPELLEQPKPFEAPFPTPADPPVSALPSDDVTRQIDQLFSPEADPGPSTSQFPKPHTPSALPAPARVPPRPAGLEQIDKIRQEANARAQKQREDLDRRMREMREHSTQRREKMLNDTRQRQQQLRERLEHMRNR